MANTERKIKTKFIKYLKRVLIILAPILLVGILFILISNLAIIGETKNQLATAEELSSSQPDCILILGAGVWSGKVPSHMLEDRLKEGLRLYQEGVAKKILVSGDHGTQYYDEVNVMKNYLMEAGVPGEDIFMDHAGFSTYESIIRARDIFGVKDMVVVSQKYHLYRALYICNRLGIHAWGVNSDPRTYHGDFMRNVREWLARDKDMFTCLFELQPTVTGDPIDIHGDGNVTND